MGALEQLLADRQNRLAQTGAAIPFMVGGGPVAQHLEDYLAPASVLGAHTSTEYDEMVAAARERDEQERLIQEAIRSGELKFSREAPQVNVKGAFGGVGGIAEAYRRKAQETAGFGLGDYWGQQADRVEAMGQREPAELLAEQQILPTRLEDIVGSEAFAPLRADQKQQHLRTLPSIGMTSDQALEKFKADNPGMVPQDFERDQEVFRGRMGGYKSFVTESDRMIFDPIEGRYKMVTNVPTAARQERIKQNGFDKVMNQVGAGIMGAGLGLIGGAALGPMAALGFGALGGAVSGYTGQAPSGLDVVMAGMPLTGKIGSMSKLAKLAATTQQIANAGQKVQGYRRNSMAPDSLEITLTDLPRSQTPRSSGYQALGG
jgi:hypothetical protein